jgi:hypothetical protein
VHQSSPRRTYGRNGFGLLPSRRRAAIAATQQALEVHVSAAVAVATAGSSCLLVGDVRDQRLRRQDHRRDRGGVPEGGWKSGV